MIADLKAGNIDWADQVPFKAVDAVKKDPNVVVTTIPGAETTNITWNSNPVKPKNRELLDPAVKKALSMCVDRDQIIDVVFAGYATKVESLVGHVSGTLENPQPGPAPVRLRCGQRGTRQARLHEGLGRHPRRAGDDRHVRAAGSPDEVRDPHLHLRSTSTSTVSSTSSRRASRSSASR